MSDNSEEKRESLTRRFLSFIAPQDEDEETQAQEEQSENAEPIAEITDVRASSYFSRAVPKDPNPLKLSSSAIRIAGLALLALVTVNLVAFSRISASRFLSLSEFLMNLFRVDQITFHLYTLLEIQVIISLILAAVLGGFLIYLMLKFAGFLAESAGLSVQRRHLTYPLAILTGLFLILFLVSRLSGHPYDTYETFRFLAPLLTYASSLILYGFSTLRFEV